MIHAHGEHEDPKYNSMFMYASTAHGKFNGGVTAVALLMQQSIRKK